MTLHFTAINEKFLIGNKKDAFQHFQELPPNEKEQVILNAQAEDNINVLTFIALRLI